MCLFVGDRQVVHQPDVLLLPQATSQKLAEIAQRMGRDVGGIDRVQGPVDQVEGGVSRVGRGVQKLDEGMEAAARGIQESIARLKRLQAPNYRYPHLVEVKETQAEGKRSVWSRLRGMFVTDVRLHFLCSFDMSKVPCGPGGNGYRLRKTRRWVKKFSPALQVSNSWSTIDKSSGSDVFWLEATRSAYCFR